MEGGRIEAGLDLVYTDVPDVETRIMMNVATPAAAMRWWRLPCRGVGLARMEYLINHVVKVHPLALTRYDALEDADARSRIDELTRAYQDRTEYFVDHLSRGIATIAAAQHPEPVVVRMSDFKTNEYANLIGGRAFEPDVMARHGLERGGHDLEVYVMAEVPSNIVEADAFAERFDGFSIGTNDLTQLVLGVDRDSRRLSYLFDEREDSVKRLIEQLIRVAHEHGRTVGICGQA